MKSMKYQRKDSKLKSLNLKLLVHQKSEKTSHQRESIEKKCISEKQFISRIHKFLEVKKQKGKAPGET